MIVADPDTFVYPTCIEFAVQLPVPTPDGVKTPVGLIVPPVAAQLTAELYAPVPWTVALQVEVCAVVIDVGEAETVTEVTTGGGAATVTDEDPVTFVYPLCVEVAVTVAEPTPDGVNSPAELTVPPVADQLTAELKAPVPITVAVQAAVCVVVIEIGIHATATDVIVGGGAVTPIVADPDTFVYPTCIELAVQLPVPTPDGVKTPVGLIVPPVPAQLTAELYAPVPWTVALQVEVCAVVIDVGEAETVTEVTTGGGAATVTDDDPVRFVYPLCVEVAVITAVPTPDGVNTPEGLIVPPVADQLTTEL